MLELHLKVYWTTGVAAEDIGDVFLVGVKKILQFLESCYNEPTAEANASLLA